MSKQVFKVDSFGALNLRDDPGELGFGACTDLLNVDFDRRGRLRTRDGYAALSNISGTLVNDITGLFTHEGKLIATTYNQNGSNDFTIFVIDSSGSIVDDEDILIGPGVKTTSGAVSFGTATENRLYIPVWDPANGNGPLIYYEGSALGGGDGNPGFVAAVGGGGAVRPQGADIAPRLAQGHYTTAADSPTGADGTRSTVFFSDPGDPDTWPADNFVTLRPGDGEEITAMVTFDGDLWVFKQSAAFVFTHETSDATGSPVFHYQEVDLPVRLSLAVGTNRRYVVAGGDAIYYSTVSGIYRITRGGVQLVSGAISEIFGVDSEYSSLRFNGDPAVLSWANDRLFATYTLNATGTRTLVYNPRQDYWTLWSNVGTTGYFVTFPPLDFAASPGTADFQERVLFPSGQDVYYTDPDLTTDAGSNISWHWTSGPTDFGYPQADRKVLGHYCELWGSGSPTVSVFTDYGSTDSSAASVTLGTAPAIARGYHSPTRQGTYFSLKLSGTSPASVNSMTMPVWIPDFR